MSARNIQCPGLLIQEGHCHRQQNNNVTCSRFSDKEYAVDWDISSFRFVGFSLRYVCSYETLGLNNRYLTSKMRVEMVQKFIRSHLYKLLRVLYAV